MIPSCDSIIVVSKSIAKGYASDYNIEKPYVILNTPNLMKISKSNYFRDKYDINKKDKIFLYQGRISKYRGIEKLVKLFETMPPSYHLVLMGHGEELQNFLSTVLANNIYVHEAVPPQNILKYTASADYGIALIEPISLSYKYCLPNKIFEYTMAGLPVITSDLPEMKRFVLDNKLGICVNFSDSLEKLKKDFILFSENENTYKTNLEKTAQQYNWETQEKILIDIYKSIKE
jgi:glycosyltransferase involved in cell wall biosynthesis